VSTSATQQFDGSTIEEALGAAVASMGDDLEILEAQRVRRRRRFGVRREERFEVIAAPRSSPEEFDDVLRRMVERVDDREREHEVDLRGPRADATVDLRAPRGGVDLADSDLSWWEGAEFVVPDLPAAAATTTSAELEIDVRTPRTALDDELFGPEPARQPQPIVAAGHEEEPAPQARLDPTRGAPGHGDAPDPTAVFAPVSPRSTTTPGSADAADRPDLPTSETVAHRPRHGIQPSPDRRAAPDSAMPTSTMQTSPAGATAWSLDALSDLGLAPLVIERVAARSPRADLDWVAALAGAIEDIAAAIDPHASNVELTGHGRHAAVDLIGGLCRGMRVGHLVIDGVRVEATPVELALAVRSCLQA
jgi:hypothetical protein